MTQVKFNRRPFASGFNSLVDDLFTDLPVLFKENQVRNGNASVNIIENENGYQLQVFAPGFEKENFNVKLEQQLLTISAEKKVEEKETKEKFVRREFNVASFKRTFTLDDKFNSDGIEAKYVNGILTLNLPRKEEVKSASKEISIQ
jgi:HSP20 family protein